MKWLIFLDFSWFFLIFLDFSWCSRWYITALHNAARANIWSDWFFLMFKVIYHCTAYCSSCQYMKWLIFLDFSWCSRWYITALHNAARANIWSDWFLSFQESWSDQMHTELQLRITTLTLTLEPLCTQIKVSPYISIYISLLPTPFQYISIPLRNVCWQ